MKKKYWAVSDYPGTRSIYYTTKELIEANSPTRNGAVENLEAKVEYLTEIIAKLVDHRKSLEADKLKELLDMRKEVTEVTEKTYKDNRWS